MTTITYHIVLYKFLTIRTRPPASKIDSKTIQIKFPEFIKIVGTPRIAAKLEKYHVDPLIK
tara:strand:+ start:382 stop:564 length:183 start_codon:yes stop_codon:yes gene_type:complete